MIKIPTYTLISKYKNNQIASFIRARTNNKLVNMKTKEQNRQDVVNYLKITSKHAFMRGKGGIFKIEETEEGVFNEFIGGIRSHLGINIDWFVDNYGNDAKHVIRKRIFYDGHGYKSIGMRYYNKLNETKKVLS